MDSKVNKTDLFQFPELMLVICHEYVSRHNIHQQQIKQTLIIILKLCGWLNRQEIQKEHKKKIIYKQFKHIVKIQSFWCDITPCRDWSNTLHHEE